jgi:hypothetical protein
MRVGEQYRGVVFKHAPPTADFTCTTRHALPGRHTKGDAWAAVFAALRAEPALVGGEVESVFAETDAERDAETLLNP